MSKRKGHRKKRRRKPAVICARCHAPADGSPAALLGSIAAVLNACDDAGMGVQFRQFGDVGAVYARSGYVLPLRDGKWTARTKTYDPFAPVPELGDEDD